MDVRMPPDYQTEGLDAARVIREEFPGIGILVLSAHAEVEQAMELLASGQRVGYLLKSRVTDVADFAETVGRVAAGGSVVDPALVQELIVARRRDDALQLSGRSAPACTSVMGYCLTGNLARWSAPILKIRVGPLPRQVAG